MRIFAAAVLAIVTLTAQTPAPSPTGVDAAGVVATLAENNAPVQHFTFAVEAHIALLTFPWIRFTMHGHGSYTRGGPYTVHFDDVPWFGKAYDTMPMDALDPTTWPSSYTMTVAGEQDGVFIISMHDLKKTRLVEARAQIDPLRGLREILWTYDYGGHVRLKVVPQEVSGFYFPASEEAEIVMPQYRAMAWATFSDYHVDAK
jgi:hypothetical protein